MPHAWIENGAVKDIAPGDPFAFYHPDVAALYDTVIPDTVERGWSLVDGAWTAPPPPPESGPAPAPQPWQTMSADAFIDMLTLEEEAALSYSADPVLATFHRRLTRPGTTVARSWVQAGVGRMVSLALMTQDRADVILAGEATV
jgi:hypothetical protein